MQQDKLLLLMTHPCAKDLDREACQEIADACELVRFKVDELLHEPNAVVENVDLVVTGRLELTAFDVHGNTKLRRYVGAGNQYGGLSAALGEPSGVSCKAIDPTTVLRLPYRDAFELTKKHDQLRINLTRLLADGVKRALLTDKAPIRKRRVAIFHHGEETRFVTRRLAQRLVELGEEPSILTDREEWEPIGKIDHRVIFREGGREVDEAAIRDHLAKWSEYPRILIDVATSIDPIRAQRAMDACNLVLWFVTPENWESSVPLLKAMQHEASGWADKVCIVWCMGDSTIVPLATELNQLASRDIKISFKEPGPNQSRTLANGFERLVHLLRGVQVGVALGGGAARGMAHLGVLQALEDAGIVVDMIAGTSAGAMTGTIYAAGMGVDYSIASFVKDLRPSWIFRHLPRGDQWFLLYKYRRGHFDPMLRNYLHDYQIEQLTLPMNSITVDLISGKVIVRDVGDAVRGIVESINLPVLSAPVIRQGQALVDGGMINNVPADVLVAKGCNYVIAVSVTAKMEMEFAKNRPDTPRENMRSPSTLQTILRTYLVQSASVNALGVQPADIVIEPDVTSFELTDFVKTDELAAIGKSATEDAMAQIRTTLNQLDAELFPT